MIYIQRSKNISVYVYVVPCEFWNQYIDWARDKCRGDKSREQGQMNTSPYLKCSLDDTVQAEIDSDQNGDPERLRDRSQVLQSNCGISPLFNMKYFLRIQDRSFHSDK